MWSRTGKPTGREFAFPPTSGVVNGWIAVLLSVGVVGYVVVDVHTKVGLRFGVGFALFGVLAYAYLLRPKIKVADEELVLVNPLEDLFIPLPLVRTVSVRATTNVFVGEKRYVGVAVGRKFREMARPARSETAADLPPWATMGPGGRSAASGAEGKVNNQVADLVEEMVGMRAAEARRQGAEPHHRVRRNPVWPLIVPSAVLALAFVVTLLI